MVVCRWGCLSRPPARPTMQPVTAGTLKPYRGLYQHSRDFRCVSGPSCESICRIRLLQCKCLWGLCCIIGSLLISSLQIFNLCGSWVLLRLLQEWQVVSAAFPLFTRSPWSRSPSCPKTRHTELPWGTQRLAWSDVLMLMSFSLTASDDRVKK